MSNETGMGKAWVLVSIPPVVGLLVFVAVWRLGTVRVPTVAEIRNAPSKMQIQRPSRDEEVDKAMREEGLREGSATEGNEKTEVAKEKPSGPYQEDLKLQWTNASNHNRAVYFWGLGMGAGAMLLGYGVVISYLVVTVRRNTRSWREVVPPRAELTKEELEAPPPERDELREDLPGEATEEGMGTAEPEAWEEPPEESPEETEGTEEGEGREGKDEDRAGV